MTLLHLGTFFCLPLGLPMLWSIYYTPSLGSDLIYILGKMWQTSTTFIIIILQPIQAIYTNSTNTQ
jgi:hypothetical protein